jgi:hypothetical protein
MKQFVIRQSIDVDVCYVIMAENQEQAEDMANDRLYDRSQIADITVLTWDKPWEVTEAEGDFEIKTMSEEALQQWNILGI